MSPISDMLVQIKNAQMVSRDRVILPFSKMKFTVAKILKDAGYLADVERRKKKGRKGELEYLELLLRYVDGSGAINGVKIVSRPSRHLYARVKDIKPVRSGFGIAILSTPAGIMTSQEARKQNVGGEILFEVW